MHIQLMRNDTSRITRRETLKRNGNSKITDGCAAHAGMPKNTTMQVDFCSSRLYFGMQLSQQKSEDTGKKGEKILNDQ